MPFLGQQSVSQAPIHQAVLGDEDLQYLPGRMSLWFLNHLRHRLVSGRVSGGPKILVRGRYGNISFHHQSVGKTRTADARGEVAARCLPLGTSGLANDGETFADSRWRTCEFLAASGGIYCCRERGTSCTQHARQLSAAPTAAALRSRLLTHIIGKKFG